jgi:CBS domain-containing protein
MNITEIYQPNPVTIPAYETLTTAAQVMREKHIGYLIVVKPDLVDGSVKPVGVITDRDIVVAVVAKGEDPRTLTVGDVMTYEPVVAHHDENMPDILARMRRIGIRRIPVLGSREELLGVLALDDILTHLADELESIVGAIRGGQVIEHTLRP